MISSVPHSAFAKKVSKPRSGSVTATTKKQTKKTENSRPSKKAGAPPNPNSSSAVCQRGAENKEVFAIAIASSIDSNRQGHSRSTRSTEFAWTRPTTAPHRVEKKSRASNERLDLYARCVHADASVFSTTPFRPSWFRPRSANQPAKNGPSRAEVPPNFVATPPSEPKNKAPPGSFVSGSRQTIHSQDLPRPPSHHFTSMTRSAWALAESFRSGGGGGGVTSPSPFFPLSPSADVHAPNPYHSISFLRARTGTDENDE